LIVVFFDEPTASRMESNGMKHRIHASQETADLLIAAGKCHWITPREEKIVAKGKGELQTFWVESKADRSLATMSSASHSDRSSSENRGKHHSNERDEGKTTHRDLDDVVEIEELQELERQLYEPSDSNQDDVGSRQATENGKDGDRGLNDIDQKESSRINFL